MASGKRVNRKSSTPAKAKTPATGPAADHYQREKARRAHKAPPESEAMAAARREYLAMLEAGATSGKRGRPKKVAAKPVKDLDEDLDELGEEPGIPADADDEVDTGTAVDEIEQE